MRSHRVFFLVLIFSITQHVFIHTMDKQDEQTLCIPDEKPLAQSCFLQRWVDYLDQKTLVNGQNENKNPIGNRFPQEIKEKIYDYILPMVNVDLKTLLNNHPEYIKEKPHTSFAIIANRLETNFGIYSDEIWNYLLTHNQPIKDLVDKACKKTAISKIEDYINQLPKPIKEYATNNAFFAQRWSACNREMLFPSIPPLYNTLNKHDTVEHLNTMTTYGDTLYAINKEQNSIVALNNQTLDTIKIEKIDAIKLQQLAYDHVHNIFYIEDDNRNLYRYNPKSSSTFELIKSKDKLLNYEYILNIDPKNQYLYLSYIDEHNSKTERIDLINDQSLLFDHNTINTHKKFKRRREPSDHHIAAAKLSFDNKYLYVETMDCHIRVYKLYPNKKSDDTIAEFIDCNSYAHADVGGIVPLGKFKKRSFIQRIPQINADLATSLGIFEPPHEKVSDGKLKSKIPVLPLHDRYHFSDRFKQGVCFPADPISPDINELYPKNSIENSVARASITTANNDQQINLFLLPIVKDKIEKQPVTKLTPKFNLMEAAWLYKFEKFSNNQVKESKKQHWALHLLKTCIGHYADKKYILYKALDNSPNKKFITEKCYNPNTNRWYKYSFIEKIVGASIHTFWKILGMFDTEGNINIALNRIAKA